MKTLYVLLLALLSFGCAASLPRRQPLRAWTAPMYNAYAVDGKCTITVFVEKPDGEIVSARHDVPAGHGFEATTDWGKKIWFTCYPPIGGQAIKSYTE